MVTLVAFEGICGIFDVSLYLLHTCVFYHKLSKHDFIESYKIFEYSEFFTSLLTLSHFGEGGRGGGFYPSNVCSPMLKYGKDHSKIPLFDLIT